MASAFEPEGLFRSCGEPGYVACHVASWLWTLVPIPLLIAGTCCNILTLIVMCRRVLRKLSTTVYLICLTSSDLFYLWTSLLEKYLLFDHGIDIRVSSNFGCSVFHWFKFTAASISLWLLVLSTFERVLFITFPVFARRKMTRKFATVACLTTIAVTSVLNSHLMVGFAKIWNATSQNASDFVNTQSSSKEGIPFGRHNTTPSWTVYSELICSDSSAWYRRFREKFWVRFASIVYVFIPTILLIAGNSVIATSLWKQRRRVEPFLTNVQRHNYIAMRSAKLLLVMCVFHLVCTTPFATFHYVYTIVDNDLNGRQFAYCQLIFIIAMLLFWSDFSFNLLLYIYNGTVFNREWQKLLKGCRDKTCLVTIVFCTGPLFGPPTVEGLPAPNVPPEERDPAYWNTLGLNDLKWRMSQKPNWGRAKNVVLFVGDGMGVSTVTAARILRGQMYGRPGEETVLNFERFPYVAQAKTYSLNRQVPDSSSSATAILSGVKTNEHLVGLDGYVAVSDCANSSGHELDTMVDWAMAGGKSVGIVTTARVTHATPASAYAHVAHRWWEGDTEMDGVAGDCKDIAKQLVDDNNDIKVIFGGGRRYFLRDNETDPETGRIDRRHRKDGRNLIDDFIKDKEDRDMSARYAWNKDMFDEIDPRFTDFALGLFDDSHMAYEVDRDKSGPTGEPSLEEMVRKAIRILEKDDDGFFLFVESARIDNAHHNNLAAKALHETLALEDAVQAALDLTDEQDTLVIVTADHSLVMNIAGTAYRGTDILGILEPNLIAIDDKKSQTVLQYSNGPGFSDPRANLTADIALDVDSTYPSGIPIPQATHSGEDVPIYARGPMAHMFAGVHEQTYIAHVMAHAACVGPYRYSCRREGIETSGADIAGTHVFIIVSLSVLILSCP